MLCVVYCCGPSINRLPGRPEADLHITVNRSVIRFESDFWVALDVPVIRDLCSRAVGKPKIFATGETAITIGRHPEAYSGLQLAQPPSVAGWMPPGINLKYSAPTALCLAAREGATEIDVYGADWTDEPDFDGHKSKDYNRGSGRWEREGQQWWSVIGWLLDQKGVIVRRRVHGSAG